MTSSCLIGLVLHWGPRRGPLPDSWASERPVGLGNGTFWDWSGVAGPAISWRCPFFIGKNGISGVESIIILGFFAFFDFGRAWPEQKGFEVDFGRRGQLTSHRIDKLFKPNWPP